MMNILKHSSLRNINNSINNCVTYCISSHYMKSIHQSMAQKRTISTVIWIKGLNELTKEDDIRSLLSDYGPLTYYRTFTASERSKIVNVIVRFQRINDALAAMDELQLTPIQGRRAVLEFGRSDLVNRKNNFYNTKKRQ